jgi:hypothetical protein
VAGCDGDSNTHIALATLIAAYRCPARRFRHSRVWAGCPQSLQSQLQFDYYQLPFCKPQKIIDLPENLGEALAGEKAHTSAFKIRMRESVRAED